MLQCFIRFPEFAEFTEFNESSVPFRKNSIVLFFCGQINLLSSEIGRQDVSSSTWLFLDFSRHFHKSLSASGVCSDQVSSVDVKQ